MENFGVGRQWFHTVLMQWASDAPLCTASYSHKLFISIIIYPVSGFCTFGGIAKCCSNSVPIVQINSGPCHCRPPVWSTQHTKLGVCPNQTSHCILKHHETSWCPCLVVGLLQVRRSFVSYMHASGFAFPCATVCLLLGRNCSAATAEGACRFVNPNIPSRCRIFLSKRCL